jgi:steroid delta-isomerase-like uncharacterized protein
VPFAISLEVSSALTALRGEHTTMLRRLLMSPEDNKTIVRRFFDEFWNAGHLDVADEIFDPNYMVEGQEAAQRAVESNKESYAFWHGVLPDIRFTVDEIIAEGDTVVVRWTAHGTHHGDWPTPIGVVPASGKATVTPGTSTYHLQDGRIIRDANHIDFVSTLQQVGAVIQSGETGK